MHADLERLAFLGIDPATLDPAPAHPVLADWLARIDPDSPGRRRCCSCGRSRSPRVSSSLRAWGGAGMTSAGTA